SALTPNSARRTSGDAFARRSQYSTTSACLLVAVKLLFSATVANGWAAARGAASDIRTNRAAIVGKRFMADRFLQEVAGLLRAKPHGEVETVRGFLRGRHRGVVRAG